MAEIRFLGTGGSVATPERDNTSFLLSHGKEKVLVDCPGSVIQKIKKIGFEPREIQSILVSHIHPDHVYGLPSYIHSLMLEEGWVDLFGSEETILFCRRFLDLFHLLDEKIKFKVRFWIFSPGEKVKLGESFEVKALSVPHHSSSLAFHFHLEEAGKEMIFSGDTPSYSPLFEEARGIDYLIHDSSAPSRYFEMYPELQRMHTSALELGRRSEEAGVKCLIPCHFLGEVEFSLAEIGKEIRKGYHGRLLIPEDFEQVKL